MLLGFVAASTVLIALGEWAAFHDGTALQICGLIRAGLRRVVKSRQTLYDPCLVDALSSSFSIDALRAVFDKMKGGSQ